MSFRSTFLAATGLGLVASDTVSAYSGSNQTLPRVTLEQGDVQGFRDNHTNSVYLGIPYAATTGGENR